MYFPVVLLLLFADLVQIARTYDAEQNRRGRRRMGAPKQKEAHQQNDV